jgi:hypothetical protein
MLMHQLTDAIVVLAELLDEHFRVENTVDVPTFPCFHRHRTGRTQNDTSSGALVAIKEQVTTTVPLLYGFTTGSYAFTIHKVILEKLCINHLTTDCTLDRKDHILEQPVLLLYPTVAVQIMLTYRETLANPII